MRELELLEKASTKRVLFVGETIIDVYHYVRPLGRPTKDAIVSVELQSTETFEGGVVATAHNAMAILKNPPLIYTSGKPIRKTRFVEGSHIRKLFEYYDGAQEQHTCDLPELGDYDAVIVTDYGHGMMTEDLIQRICNESTYLAVNVQTNSGNYGYNLCTKYPGADFLCLDEPEARLATQNRYGPIRKSLEDLSRRFKRICVTLGKAGAIGVDHGRFYECPAYTDTVVDTIGAGDAFFAVASCIAKGAHMDQILRIGNAAGALKSKIIGHRSAIKKEDLIALLSDRA